MTNFTSIVKASQGGLVYLAQGKEKPTNQDAWYYVQIKSKSLVPIFLKKIKDGIDLLDYGTILYSGWGAEPPEDIRQKIKVQFS